MYERNPLPRNTALREGLPYGAVMATAGASAVADACGLRFLSGALLALAILQAGWLLLSGLRHYRAELHSGWPAWLAIGPSHEHTGVHTVPLGVAVIASGLASLGLGHDTAWLLGVTAIWLALAWVFTVVCVGRFVQSVAAWGFELKAVDGTWFLVPAAVLGIGEATGGLAVHLTNPVASSLAALALATDLLGWAGYWLVAALAYQRIRNFGSGSGPRGPWWISMGCAGLAAAAVAGILENPVFSEMLQTVLTAAATLTAIVSIGLFVPVAVSGMVFLLKSCRFRDKASWAPTFSTAVCALGCLQTAGLLHWPTFRVLGLAAAAATLLFWLVTAAWNSGFHRLGRHIA